MRYHVLMQPPVGLVELLREMESAGVIPKRIRVTPHVSLLDWEVMSSPRARLAVARFLSYSPQIPLGAVEAGILPKSECATLYLNDDYLPSLNRMTWLVATEAVRQDEQVSNRARRAYGRRNAHPGEYLPHLTLHRPDPDLSPEFAGEVARSAEFRVVKRLRGQDLYFEEALVMSQNGGSPHIHWRIPLGGRQILNPLTRKPLVLPES